MTWHISETCGTPVIACRCVGCATPIASLDDASAHVAASGHTVTAVETVRRTWHITGGLHDGQPDAVERTRPPQPTPTRARGAAMRGGRVTDCTAGRSAQPASAGPHFARFWVRVRSLAEPKKHERTTIMTKPPEPPPTYVKRHPMWTLDACGWVGLSWDEAARRDDELQDRWDAEEKAERKAVAQQREDLAERRRLDLAERTARLEAEAKTRADRAEKLKLDIAEQRLRVNDRLRRLRARQVREQQGETP